MVFFVESKEKKAAPREGPPLRIRNKTCYLFDGFAAARSFRTACAAASRAIGTRYGEQET
jgi:hypothetical protein